MGNVAMRRKRCKSVSSGSNYSKQGPLLKFVCRVVNVTERIAAADVICPLSSPCASHWSSTLSFRQAGWRARKARSLTTAPWWLENSEEEHKCWLVCAHQARKCWPTHPSVYLRSQEPKKHRRTWRCAEWDKRSDFSCSSGFLCRFCILHLHMS